MTREIELSKSGDYRGMFVALVDDEDFEFLSKLRWSLCTPYKTKKRVIRYASRTIDGKFTYMHQFIMGKRDGYMIDHIDGNGLNNTRGNLRFVTNKENIENNYSKRQYDNYAAGASDSPHPPIPIDIDEGRYV